MDYAEHVDAVVAETQTLAAAFRKGEPEARVPSCPDWAVADLAEHVGGFTGFNPAQGTPTAGPNGVVVIDSRNELWASDGDSTVKVINLQSRQIVAVISTGGVKRADLSSAQVQTVVSGGVARSSATR